MKIIGAGMAGLLAANMLRRFNPEVHEALETLPDNHTALLRFRTPEVSNSLGIPFEKVTVRKGIWDGSKIATEPNIRLANIYSQTVCGELDARSIWDLSPEDRWLAPPDFISQMASGLDILAGSDQSLIVNQFTPFHAL